MFFCVLPAIEMAGYYHVVPPGPGMFFGLGFYKYAAPTALGYGGRDKKGN
jgi:hypothetical protein